MPKKIVVVNTTPQDIVIGKIIKFTLKYLLLPFILSLIFGAFLNSTAAFITLFVVFTIFCAILIENYSNSRSKRNFHRRRKQFHKNKPDAFRNRRKFQRKRRF
ncbi:MAG: hypothetical protein ACMXYF_03235 [Candidatus Woesearchaeota archaeon]